MLFSIVNIFSIFLSSPFFINVPAFSSYTKFNELLTPFELVHNTEKMIDKISKNKSINYDDEILMNRIDNIEKEKTKYLKLDRDLLIDLEEWIINQTEYEEYRKDYCKHINELNKIKKELNHELKSNKSNSIANKKWINTFTEFKQIEKLNSKIIYELIDNIYRRKWWN